MELHKLPKILSKKSKRIGRGHGSGRGKTAGRGTKGQKAKGKIALYFEGGALPLIKKLPFLRGRGRNKVFKTHPIALNIKDLNKLPGRSVVDVDVLIKNSIVSGRARKSGVKILGEGRIEKALTIKIPISKSAAKEIERAGGKIEIQ